METNQKITYGLIGVLSLIVATMGGTMYLSEDQLDNAFVCTTNQNVVIADYLSSTHKTAYWYDENETLLSKVCYNGYWLNLKEYAEENGIEINVLLQQLNEEEQEEPQSNYSTQYGVQYRCDSTKCTRIR